MNKDKSKKKEKWKKEVKEKRQQKKDRRMRRYKLQILVGKCFENKMKGNITDCDSEYFWKGNESVIPV